MIRRFPTICAVSVLFLVPGCSPQSDPGRSTPSLPATTGPAETAIASPDKAAPVAAATRQENPATADLSARVAEPDDSEDKHAADAVPKTASRIPAASLERAGKLRLEAGPESDSFRQELRSIAKDLPSIGLSPDASRVVWNRVVINSTGRQFDAVRFTSPLTEPADVLWTFVTPGLPPIWNILPATGSLPPSGESKSEQNLHLPATDFPKTNIAFFQAFRGGHIQPGQEYILWFASNDKRALEYQVAIRLVPAATTKTRFTTKALARDMGLDWPLEPTPAAIRILQGQDDGIARVRFTPDGSRIVAAGDSGKVCVWDSASGALTAEFQTGHETLQLMELSPDGKTLAMSPGTPPEITLWDLATRSPMGSLPGHNTRCSAIAFSSDGGHLAAAYGAGPDADQIDGEIILWDLRTQRPAATFPTGRFRTNRLTVTPDGMSIIATGGVYVWQEGGARFVGSLLNRWNIASAERTTLFEDRHQVLRDLLVSGDGTRVIVGTSRGLVRLLEGKPLRVAASMQEDAPLNALAWSPDETLLALACQDGTLRVWDVTRHTWRSVRKADWRSVTSASFSPDGRSVASAGWDGSVRLWDVGTLGTTPEEFLTQEIRDRPALTNSIGMNMVPIPAGKSLRGAPDEDDHPRGWPAPEGRGSQRPRREITLTKPFYMAAHEVTVGIFRRFVEATGYQTEAETNGKGGKCFDNRQRRFVHKAELTWRTPGFEQTDEHPVTQITWNDAQAFCKWLSTTESLNYRLPTEAEWEHACRAGSRSSGWMFGNDGGGFPESLNTADFRLRRIYSNLNWGGNWDDGYAYTAPVGSFAPNAFGLYDMHGNVFEWCQDWFDAFYYANPTTTDPQGPPTGKQRVQRGGSFFNHHYDATFVFRSFDEPDSPVDNTGFRPVREIP